MPFHQKLIEATVTQRQALTGLPIVTECLLGQVSLASYQAFLTQAYHHVRQTVPLLKGVRQALRPGQRWLEAALDEYIEEEAGHDEWVLDDLRACGADSEAVRLGQPGPATAAMVAHAWALVERGNPLGFFGMVLVLEGTSVALALAAADSIQSALGLPDTAFSYLRSHGTLDQEHVGLFEVLMDQVTDEGDQRAIVDAARAFYRLYADVFRSLPRAESDSRVAGIAA
ncbi:MAG: hypothetical protein RL322_1274 [Pseudomonadota bacterium]|jgi:pyrroloquinoline quinone (PQQ) biosynthesis protein C